MEVLLSVLLFYLFFAFLDRNIWKRKGKAPLWYGLFWLGNLGATLAAAWGARLPFPAQRMEEFLRALPGLWRGAGA